MSALVLISGALARAPESRISKSGKAYVTCSIKLMADNAPEFWSILAFSETAQAELLRLGEGDKVSVQGSFKIELYVARDNQTKISRTLFADHVLALRQPPRERKPRAAPTRAPDDGAPSNQNNGRDFDDSIPF
jgi:single-stranded DNA-binding protein